MTTMIQTHERVDNGYLFRSTRPVLLTFGVRFVEEDFVILEFFQGTDIKDVAKMLEGAFEQGSNFQRKIWNIFGITALGVKFMFNGVIMKVTAEKATAGTIYWLYHEGVAKRNDDDAENW